MEIYYQNETLYIELLEDLDELKYYRLKNKIFRILKDYEVDKVILQNHHQIFSNKHYLRQMKQDFKENYEGDFYIR